MSRFVPGLLALVALGGCPAEPEPKPAEGLGAVALTTRLSLDLRGVRPSLADLDRALTDPGAVDALRDEYLDDPRLEGRVRDWFAEPYRTRLDSFPATTAQFGLDPSVEPAFQRSIGDEPLRLLGRVAVSDRPWTEVVTADWSMADEVLAGVYPVAYPEGASGWQEVKWTDHRPSAGVLTTNGLWWRYGSTEENYNRGRANAVSRILLCQDFLVRPVTFPRSSVVVDAAALLDQTRTNEACVSCHVSVDPLGSYLFGFSYGDVAFVSPDYDPSSELSWQSGTGLAPSYFGEPGGDLTDLGRQIAADPRFPACTTEQVFEALVGRRHEDPDLDPLTGHREAFLSSDLRLKALVKSITQDPLYLGVPEDSGLEASGKMLSVEQLDSAVADLTGFRWSYYGYDLLANDGFGFRTLAGGMDGESVTRPTRSPSPTIVLVQQRLAELAAAYAVDHDGDRPEAEKLLPGIDGSEGPESDEIARVASRLHRRVLGRTPTDAETEALVGLWTELEGLEGDGLTAWAGVLTALLRDPEFLIY